MKHEGNGRVHQEGWAVGVGSRDNAVDGIGNIVVKYKVSIKDSVQEYAGGTTGIRKTDCSRSYLP